MGLLAGVPSGLRRQMGEERSRSEVEILKRPATKRLMIASPLRLLEILAVSNRGDERVLVNWSFSPGLGLEGVKAIEYYLDIPTRDEGKVTWEGMHHRRQTGRTTVEGAKGEANNRYLLFDTDWCAGLMLRRRGGETRARFRVRNKGRFYLTTSTVEFLCGRSIKLRRAEEGLGVDWLLGVTGISRSRGVLARGSS
ncbi:hypothetical protein BDP27DRAFT_1495045 [Rhodocollybia butyracea]|uniref:Uncharacterized protein n=1 Tax=Rhodocollybia butyracea TaxID=206335 RepID=A0A9P5TZ88_9AGAR|nr:hypothetical protein BDP27DRAFT_1495045 [Rhodocollybia butyracea]